MHPTRNTDDDDLPPAERSILLGLEVALRQHATLLFKTLNSAPSHDKDAAIERYKNGLHNLLDMHAVARGVALGTFDHRKK